MPNFEIGLSGLNVAQRAIEIIGTNIANVSTSGYHRQNLQVVPVGFNNSKPYSAGGAKISHVSRSIDVLLESQILRQSPLSGQLSQELMALQSIEQSLGTLDSQGLLMSLNSFFTSMRELSSEPGSRSLQEQAIWAASGMADEFRNLDFYLQELDRQILLEAQNLVSSVNSLVDEIAGLNVEISGAVTRGSNANLLKDRRDQALVELSQLVPVQTNPNDLQNETQSVLVWGTPMVTKGSTTHFQVGVTDDGELGVSVKGVNFYQCNMRGGRLGALLEIKNNLLADVRDNVNTLALSVMREINNQHVQGIGAQGSFNSLVGTPLKSMALSDLYGVQAGEFYIRITDTDTGVITRHAISVDPATDSLDDVVDRINALTIDGDQPITASIAGGALRFESSGGYLFDFTPAMLPTPTTSNLTGSSSPTISGVYSGNTQTYTFEVVEAGETGSDAVRIAVTDGEGNLVKTLQLGQGYAADEFIEVDQGITVSFSMGDLKLGDTFTVLAVGNADTSGVLGAAGMNVLFRGTGSSDIRVNDEIVMDPERFATGISGDDNENVLRLTQIEFLKPQSLGGKSPQDFYQQLVAGIGQQVKLRQTRKDTLDNMLQQLENQRDVMSGVDINEQAAQLIVYEKMFQAMARFIHTLDETLNQLVELV